MERQRTFDFLAQETVEPPTQTGPDTRVFGGARELHRHLRPQLDGKAMRFAQKYLAALGRPPTEADIQKGQEELKRFGLL